MPRYDLKEKIGEGGMGAVYRAIQNPLGREVAIKVLRSEIARDKDRLKRFQREVTACLRLAHPNIVKILDSGERDGQYYFVMELLSDGRPLDVVLAADGAMMPRVASDVVSQVLEALAYSHEHQILHRDLKPANIMLRPGGLATLMDFGLAKDLNATTLLTQAGHSVGTPRYMAPEMFTPAEPTPAVDIWAIGCLFYELLTSKPPFDGGSIIEIATRISCGEYIPATTLRPDLPPGTDELIARFLAKDPGDRFATAQDAADELRTWGTVTSRAIPAITQVNAPDSASMDRTTRTRGDRPTGLLPATERIEPRADSSGGPRSRSSTRGRSHVRIAALLLGAAGLGLAIGLLLRFARHAIPTTVQAPSFARAVGDLAVQEGVTSLEVTFESPLSAGLVVEADVREATPRKVRVSAELTTASGRIALVPGLPPASRVRIRVLGSDGSELAWRDVTTRSLSEVATELARSLDHLAPYATGQRMIHEVEKSMRIKDATERAQKLSGVRSTWELKLRELMSHGRLEPLVADVAPVMEQLMASHEVSAESRRRIYEHVQELGELEEIAALSKIPLPALAARLITRNYGFAYAPALTAPQAAVYQLGGDEGEPRAYLKGTDPFTITRMSGEHLIIYSDLRRGSDMFMSTFGEGQLAATEAVPLPPPDRVKQAEVTAMVSRGNPANGIRVMVSGTRSKDRKDWRSVAVLPFRDLTRHAISHRVPVELLRDRPLYMRLELAYSPVRFVFQNQVEQECWLHWFALAWSEEAAGVGAPAPAH